MAAYLLDSNHAASLVTLSHPLRQRFLQGLQAGHDFAICVPVLTEVLFGIGILPRAQQNLAEWNRLRPFLPCYMPDEIDAEHAADLPISFRRQVLLPVYSLIDEASAVVRQARIHLQHLLHRLENI